MRAIVGLVVFGVVFTGSQGCSKNSSNAGAPDAATAAAEPVDAGIPAPTELSLSVTGTIPDGGVVELPLKPEARPEVAQVQQLQILSNLPLRDYRIRLFDEADRAMVSDDTAENDPDGGVSLYRISLPEPLKTGYGYALVLDAQTGAQLTDVYGRNHPDLRLEFKIAGEREKPTPPVRHTKSKRRRRHH